MADQRAKHPDRPFLFEGDFPKEPPPEKTLDELNAQYERQIQEDYPSARFEEARDRRIEVAERANNGPAGLSRYTWPREPIGATSPREEAQMLEFQREAHLAAGGAGEQAAPVAVQGGTPFKFGG